MAKTLFDVKNDLQTIGAALAAKKQDLLAKASEPNASVDDIKAIQAQEANLQTRYDTLKAAHDQMESEQKAKLAGQASPIDNATDSKAKVMAAKASLIRATIKDDRVGSDVRAALGDNNATGGENILPTTMTNELLHEPFVRNPLRTLSTFTSVTNLEIPKVTFTLSDDDFIEDTELAKEMKSEGGKVTFNRNKFKVFAPISETILAATDTNLVQTVDNALASGLAAKEKKVAFAVTPKAGEEHMSFYGNGITEIPGASLYIAIKKAIADLPEDFRENASIAMRYSDYMDIVELLANGNATLYGAQPEQILGKPVEFSDAAVDPVVGDFRYSHFNYDPQIMFDRDKDVLTGVWNFVLTAWFDHRIKLKSAFRIAKKS